ncbi:hypothetical protein EBB54_15465 [Schaedlerella arabinosiphila]|uniref:Uncharacterized protein n=1 Tax=Schaedlerella arabinosiphila TaxID=2044587 RepID=A0A426DI92_9FIRM|nr:heparinase II/III family protein [Schaedlerella arabinosiphila]MCI8748632.1 hypothetical protein [Lachnospiraceae bacterium]RRK32597.1 hypothetical protein EBB54_15465 [Schaedlerella arabinosiphila]
MKLKIKNKGDLIRLRNIIAYKVFKNSTKINKFVGYRIPRRKCDNYLVKSLIDITQIDASLIVDEVNYYGKMTMENRFDLLGSGWVRYRCDIKDDFRGQYEYRGIPWNVDIKTGYRWAADYLDENDCIHSPEGVDIKNVWELGRMNYLVPFSLHVLSETDRELQMAALIHYRNVIEDFTKNNPVGIGVNWVLPMEASIRISNILISYDVLKQTDDKDILDTEFTILIGQLVYSHIKFIWNNLEKNIFGGKNGNHYYSDIVGLLVATGYLQNKNVFTKKVYNYAREEFFKETKEQFYSEGGHFEGSTGYFKLVAEMAVFGTAMLIRNGEVIPGFVMERLYNNKNLAVSLRKTNHSYYSFGDCDSGRFVKVVPHGRFLSNSEAESKYLNLDGYTKIYGKAEKYFLEDDSSMDSLIRYTDGLIANTKNDTPSLEAVMVYQLAGKRLNYQKKYTNGNMGAEQNDKKVQISLNLEQSVLEKYPIKKSTELIDFKTQNKLLDFTLFSKMGFCVIRSDKASLLFRFGTNERSGHGHNDTLHYEYEVDGISHQKDPGTFTYTGYPEKRNAYRSAKAHNVPYYGQEQREFQGIFGYRTADNREIVEFTKSAIAVRYRNMYFEHIRRIVIRDNKVLVEDYGKRDFDIHRKMQLRKSPAYGVIDRNIET